MVERITQVGDDNGKDEFQSERGNSRRKEKENIGRCGIIFERGHKEKKDVGSTTLSFFQSLSLSSLFLLSLSLSLHQRASAPLLSHRSIRPLT